MYNGDPLKASAALTGNSKKSNSGVSDQRSTRCDKNMKLTTP